MYIRIRKRVQFLVRRYSLYPVLSRPTGTRYAFERHASNADFLRVTVHFWTSTIKFWAVLVHLLCARPTNYSFNIRQNSRTIAVSATKTSPVFFTKQFFPSFADQLRKRSPNHRLFNFCSSAIALIQHRSDGGRNFRSSSLIFWGSTWIMSTKNRALHVLDNGCAGDTLDSICCRKISLISLFTRDRDHSCPQKLFLGSKE